MQYILFSLLSTLMMVLCDLDFKKLTDNRLDCSIPRGESSTFHDLGGRWRGGKHKVQAHPECHGGLLSGSAVLGSVWLQPGGAVGLWTRVAAPRVWDRRSHVSAARDSQS